MRFRLEYVQARVSFEGELIFERKSTVFEGDTAAANAKQAREFIGQGAVEHRGKTHRRKATKYEHIWPNQV